MSGRRQPLLLALALLCCAGSAAAQDAVRGAQLYLQLPAGVASCVSCHGPDPSQNRNELLRAANNPRALQKALNAIGAMGYLKTVLGDADVADLSAYLGRVVVLVAADAPLSLWPVTLEFGAIAFGGASPAQRLHLRNRRDVPLALTAPRVAGSGYQLSHDCALQLGPGATCTMTLHALAGAPGAAPASLVIEAGGLALVAGLSSVVRETAIGALTPEAAADVEFGDVAVGASSTLEVAMLSSGTLPVWLGVTTLTGPRATQFGVAGDCTVAKSIEPGSRCTLKLTFKPSAAGDAQAALQLRTDGTHPPALVLEGRGVGAPPIATPPSAPPVEVLPQGGGGCSSGPPGQPADPLAPALSLFAALGLLRRRHCHAPVTADSWLLHADPLRSAGCSLNRRPTEEKPL